MSTAKRRQSGEGGISTYYLRDGSARYLIKAWVETPDGEKKQVLRRGYPTKKAAADALLTLRSESRDTGYIAPAKVTVGAHLGQWLAGLRLAQSTVASYRRNIRLHVTPHIGDVPLGKLTSASWIGCTATWRPRAAATEVGDGHRVRCSTCTRSSGRP